jgi:hypothetical protein
MPSSFHVASALAGIAGARRTSPPRKHVDSPTGIRGLCQPTLFQRIGIMAASGDHHPRQTTPAFIATGPGYTPDNRKRMRADKPSGRTIDGTSRTPPDQERSGRAPPGSLSVCRRHAPARAGPTVG